MIRAIVQERRTRFAPGKPAAQQAVLMQHRTRDFPVRQLTQIVNPIRGQLAEFGLVVPKGVHNLGRLVTKAKAADPPIEARMPPDLLVGQVTETKARIDAITADLRRAAKADDTARRMQTIPGIGPITASGQGGTPICANLSPEPFAVFFVWLVR